MWNRASIPSPLTSRVRIVVEVWSSFPSISKHCSSPQRTKSKAKRLASSLGISETNVKSNQTEAPFYTTHLVLPRAGTDVKQGTPHCWECKLAHIFVKDFGSIYPNWKPHTVWLSKSTPRCAVTQALPSRHEGSRTWMYMLEPFMTRNKHRCQDGEMGQSKPSLPFNHGDLSLVSSSHINSPA